MCMCIYVCKKIVSPYILCSRFYICVNKTIDIKDTIVSTDLPSKETKGKHLKSLESLTAWRLEWQAVFRCAYIKRIYIFEHAFKLQCLCGHQIKINSILMQIQALIDQVNTCKRGVETDWFIHYTWLAYKHFHLQCPHWRTDTRRNPLPSICRLFVELWNILKSMWVFRLAWTKLPFAWRLYGFLLRSIRHL